MAAIAADMLIDVDLSALVARHREQRDAWTLLLRTGDPRESAFGTIGVDDFASSAIADIDAAGLDRFVLVGHSMGGLTIAEVARRHSHGGQSADRDGGIDPPTGRPAHTNPTRGSLPPGRDARAASLFNALR